MECLRLSHQALKHMSRIVDFTLYQLESELVAGSRAIQATGHSYDHTQVLQVLYCASRHNTRNA